jgi:hypothetical protein
VWSNNNLPYYLFESNNSIKRTETKNPFRRAHPNQKAPQTNPPFPQPFPRNLPETLLPKNFEQPDVQVPVLIPHPDYRYNNSVFRGYLRNGQKNGFCAFRLSLGEIILVYFYQNRPISFEATIFYQNSESCSIVNEHGYNCASVQGSQAGGY